MMYRLEAGKLRKHYSDVIMSAMASQITSVSIVYSAICSDADHQSSVSLAYVRGIHDVIMKMTEKKTN